MPEYLQSSTWGQPQTLNFTPITQNIGQINAFINPKVEEVRLIPDYSSVNPVKPISYQDIEQMLSASPSHILKKEVDPTQNSMYLIMD